MPFINPEPALANGLLLGFFEKEDELAERENAGEYESLSASRKSVLDGREDDEDNLFDGRGALWEPQIGEVGDGGDQNVVRAGVSKVRYFGRVAASANSLVAPLVPLAVSDDEEPLGLGAGDPLGDLLGEGRGKSWSSSSSLMGTAATTLGTSGCFVALESSERRDSPELRL